ncbi:MAG TPA: hypothetical protein VK973_13950 [Arenicellales bacterium]|nr:hypothetical protein [Arenicellales bacterium]
MPKVETRIISKAKNTLTRLNFVQAVVIVTDDDGKRYSHTLHCPKKNVKAEAERIRGLYVESNRAAA